MVIDRGANVLLLDAPSLSQVLPLLPRLKGVAILLWAGEKREEHIGQMKEVPRLNNLFGLRYPDAPPRPWELLAVIRRLQGLEPTPQSYLNWGASLFERVPETDGDRDEIVQEVEAFCRPLVGDRQAASLSEVAHELLMNAMYDAPADEGGRPLFAHDRQAAIQLEERMRPRFFYGSDGTRLLLSVADSFGRLTRDHLLAGVHRALSQGTMDRSGGGAGLGFFVIFNSSSLIFVDVVPGRLSQVTSIVELDVPQREQRTLPKSIHLFSKDT